VLYSSGTYVPLFLLYTVNKKHITILVILLLGLSIEIIFFIDRNKEKINEQPWKTILAIDYYGVSVDYPPNLTAQYLWREGIIIFFEGPIENNKMLRSRIMLLTNTKLEHHPDGVGSKRFENLPGGHTYANAAVYSGEKFVDFELYDLDESTANRIISSLKF